jgi:hypothetical protein
MDNASKNATDMISRLQMQYNRGRQAAITNELVDIITGKLFSLNKCFVLGNGVVLQVPALFRWNIDRRYVNRSFISRNRYLEKIHQGNDVFSTMHNVSPSLGALTIETHTFCAGSLQVLRRRCSLRCGPSKSRISAFWPFGICEG